MSTFGADKSNQWNIYTSSDPSSSQTEVNQDGPWKSLGTSMNAISFGFVATAILISMFLVMAIFEHLFRPSESYSSSSSSSTSDRTDRNNMESIQLQKFRDLQRGSSSTTYSSDFSVLMPGQRHPTFIAQPAPLPCHREGVYWPSHQHI